MAARHGFRVSELCELRWDQIDLAAGLLHVTRKKNGVPSTHPLNGDEIRAKVIAEGANLAVTQRGRVAFALIGGRIDTDAIDNSAGVDTSDHEVNIKILLDQAIASGALAPEDRQQLDQAEAVGPPRAPPPSS